MVTTSKEGERRLLSVFFSDLSGYTALTEQLDAEDVRAIMDRVATHATAIVEKYGGRIDRFLGDAVMGVFGDRVSHEDDAERAVRAVLDLQAAVDELGKELEPELGRRISMHSGINTGMVVIGTSLDTAVGDAINVASRLEALSEPGQILIGPETARLVAGVFATEDHGQHVLKGRESPVPVTLVLGLAPVRPEPSRRQGTFVGREDELATLNGAAARLLDGESSVVTIEAEAGAGKTRLLAEFRDRLPLGVRWLEGRAYSYGENIPYAAVIDLVGRAIGITEEDDPSTIESKLREAVLTLDGDTDRLLAPLSRLFGIPTPEGVALDRETYRRRLLETVVAFVESLSRSRPTVVAFQDLHWADPSTVELVREATARLVEPVLVVANYRPGFQLGVPDERHIVLADLSARQATDLMASLLDDVELPEGFAEFVVGRTDGNPFFIEEVVNSLVETEVLVRNDDRWVLTADLESIGLPTSIRGVIGARIDRFDERRRQVLREAAVVGREFLYDVVADVTTVNEELDPSLRDLEAADLIRERAPDPDLEYFFKHALTQEVAYEGLLKSERQRLHARAAAAIEKQFTGRHEEVAETLAYHYAQSGITDRAVYYLRAAGRKAIERFALAESQAHYAKAYDLLVSDEASEDTDRAVVDLLLDWAFLAYYQARLADLLDLLQKHHDAVDRVGDLERLGMWTGWIGHCQYMANGEYREALRSLDRAVELGREASSARVIAYAQAWRAWCLWFLGRFAEAERDGNEAGALSQQLPDEPYPWIKSQGAAGVTLAMRGQFDRAKALGEELIGFGRETGNTRSVAMGNAVLGHVAEKVRDAEGMRRAYEAVVDAGVDPIYLTAVEPGMFSSLAIRGQFVEARAFLDDHVATSVEGHHLWALKRLFEMYEGLLFLVEGSPGKAFDRVETVMREAAQDDEGLFELAGEFLLAGMYVEVALAPTPSLATIIKNLRFVVGRGRRAKQEARDRLEALLAKLTEADAVGYRFRVEDQLAQLLARDGEREQAVAHLAAGIAAAESAGEVETLREARRLLEELTSDSIPP